MQNLEKCKKDIEKLQAELVLWKQRSNTKQHLINLLKIQNQELNKRYNLN